jgi:hypothetical protein
LSLASRLLEREALTLQEFLRGGNLRASRFFLLGLGLANHPVQRLPRNRREDVAGGISSRWVTVLLAGRFPSIPSSRASACSSLNENLWFAAVGSKPSRAGDRPETSVERVSENARDNERLSFRAKHILRVVVARETPRLEVQVLVGPAGITRSSA